jgi:hypothetical protein
MAKDSAKAIEKAGKSFKNAAKAGLAKAILAKAGKNGAAAPARSPPAAGDHKPNIADDLAAGKNSPAMGAYFK